MLLDKNTAATELSDGFVDAQDPLLSKRTYLTLKYKRLRLDVTKAYF